MKIYAVQVSTATKLLVRARNEKEACRKVEAGPSAPVEEVSPLVKAYYEAYGW